MLRIVSTCLLLISGHALAQDADGDGFEVSADCDDSNPSVFPGAIELPADGVDQSCDGFELCFVDADLDGFGDATGTMVSTANLACDGAGQAATDTDCNDADPTIYPGALEIPADGIDQDCDSADLYGCYEDADLDGYGSTNVIGAPGDPFCAQPGNSLLQSDCDDSNPAVYPGAPEICGDGIDNDCDGIGAGVDDEDNDGLTYAEEALLGTSDCDSDSDGDGSDDIVDCSPTMADVFPGATEMPADGVDQNCDGLEACFRDADGDGVGSTSTVLSASLSCAETGEALTNTDCNDLDASTFPGASELCDTVDNDCDGLTDDADPDVYGASSFSPDADGDGYGDAQVVVVACDPPAGHVENMEDCDDGDASVNPDATEIVADGVDQDCDGSWLCYVDMDEDGSGANTGETVPSPDPDCDALGESSNMLDCDDTDPSRIEDCGPDTTPSTDTGTGTAGGTPTYDSDTGELAEKGCACTSAPSSSPSGAFLLLSAAVLRLRRR